MSPRTLSASIACAIATLLVAVSALLPPAAAADSDQVSLMTDDTALLYGSVARMEQTLAYMKALGVDRVKVSMVWGLVAPGAYGRSLPHFDASDPAAYPTVGWLRYDEIVEEAGALGLGVYFQLTAPAPLWATSPAPETSGYPFSDQPNATMFQQFVRAVGARYSGSFVPNYGSERTSANAGLLPAAGRPLPAVNWWGIWNEPNEIGWLSPQTRTVGGRQVPYAPVLDRALTNAGFEGLLASGHGQDTILIGETASGGTTLPLPFVRALYCVDARLRPLTGAAAVALRCPPTGDVRTFVTENPGLFAVSGYAHHPYSFDHGPSTPFARDPGIITLANLGRLERTIDGIFRTYSEPTGLPFYLSEWGYKSNPPNPFVRTSLAEQAAWLDQGEYLAWRDPRVKALNQYLLYDQPPDATKTPGTLAYWGTFQTGLLFVSGRAKPSLAAYRLPIFLPSPHPGPAVFVWGHLRPADHDVPQTAELQFAPAGSSRFQPLTTVTTNNSEGFFTTRVAIPRTGALRLEWSPPGGAPDYSRTQLITRG